MTISFDSPTFANDKGAGAGSRQDPIDDPCGERLDWLSGLQGLRRSVGPSSEMSEALLTRVIEREIIPRLFLAHRAQPETSKPSIDVPPAIDIGDSEGFAKLVLSSEPAEIMDRVQALVDRGISLQRIYLDLLAPVARRLGEFWEADRCTFVDVSIGLSRLQQVLREIGRRNAEGLLRSARKRRVYLVPAPGEQHTFGLSMVEEFFLHAGWETASEQVASESTILNNVSQQQLDVIGFSLSCEQFLDPTLDLIKRAREASLNRDVAVMVGGRLMLDQPEIATRIQNTAIVSDGGTAVDTAEGLLGQGPSLAAIPQRT